MLDFKQKIHSLAQRNQNSHPDVYAITAYEKAGDLTTNQLETRIKSHLLKSLRSHSKLASLAKVHEQLVEYTLELLQQKENHNQGLVIFLQFNADRLEHETRNIEQIEENILFAEIISLYQKPDTHIYVGKIFDFSPLFRLDRKTPLAAVVQVDNQKAKIYTLTGTNFQLEEELENYHNQSTDNEYREVHHVGGAGKIHQGSGSENIARRQITANKAFLDQLVEPIEELINENNQRNLAVFASKNYQPYVEKWAEQFTQLLPFEPMIEYKLIKDENKLNQVTAKKLDQHKQELIRTAFLEDKENYQQFAQGWKDVTDAVRESRVERLYIVPNGNDERPGFILDQRFPYSYPVKNSSRVNNLLPWLTQGTIATGGKVITGKVLAEVSEKTIAAKLRYTG